MDTAIESLLEYLKASDGSGNASTATVQSVRSGGATTINVDTTQGLPAYFVATMGTPHTFEDPITGEDITIISEASAVDFAGHVDGSDLEIDEIAPGYVDGGSEVGDIVIIRPTTLYADTLAAVIEEAVESARTGWHKVVDTSWTYSSWSSTTKIGVITVPSGATTRYSKGQKVWFTQSTGGSKYGFIMDIASTSLTVYFGTDYTLNNEAISNPYFSRDDAPQGFPLEPSKWTQSATLSTDINTTSATYVTTGLALQLGIGAWNLKAKIPTYAIVSAAVARQGFFTLSSNASSETDPETTVGLYASGSGINTSSTLQAEKDDVVIASATTFTLMYKVSSGTSFVLYLMGATLTPARVEAVCGYL